MNSEHIVKSFDEELKNLNAIIIKMGSLAQSRLSGAMESIMSQDTKKARMVIKNDKQIDQLET